MFVRSIKYLMGLIVVLGFVALGWTYIGSQTVSENGPITFKVHRRTLVDTVVERGTLESQNTRNGKCELPGWQNKIIFIMPEGSPVKKGQVVVRFDSEEIDSQVRTLESQFNTAKGEVKQAEEDIKVQKNTNESNIAAADLALKLADLDLEKYIKSDFEAERDDLNRSIKEAEAELEKTEDELTNTVALVKKGFLPPEILREIRLRKSSAKFRLDRDRSKLTGLIEFQKPRRVAELEFTAKEAKRKFKRSKQTAEAEIRKKQSMVEQKKTALTLVEQQLNMIKKFRDKCEIKAPIDGTLAYANKPWFDSSERIKEGSSVHREQDVFYLPDMTRMQVNVGVHESLINKVEKGQEVLISVDAYPDVRLKGKVAKVSQLASSSRRSNTNSYEANILIDSFPDGVKLKPGMTAEVEIQVGTYKDVLAVPVSGATEILQQNYVYVRQGGTYKRRLIELGRFTNSFLEIKNGLKVGEVIALDAYNRGQTEFSDQGIGEKKKPTPTAVSQVN